MKKFKRLLGISILVLLITGFIVATITVFFDQAVIARKGTIYRLDSSRKIVALTFDDGPSPKWTPQILDELKRANIKATFFMLGKHVDAYPEIAKRVADEGHEIGNHSYDHGLMLFDTKDTLRKEISSTEAAIKKATGVTTRYFRPPKAWLTDKEKALIKSMGYRIVLWTLNSKDWVTFDDKYMRNYIVKHIRPGDIILFHDSGGVFASEGGDRNETVRTIFRLSEKLRERGYTFVTISEIVDKKGRHE